MDHFFAKNGDQKSRQRLFSKRKGWRLTMMNLKRALTIQKRVELGVSSSDELIFDLIIYFFEFKNFLSSPFFDWREFKAIRMFRTH